MPKQTFFNLSESKREKLLESADLEFTRVPFFEASIANIVKTAGISRGSFYQYFEDKEDVYFYLLEAKLRKAKVYFSGLLEKHQGDLIEAVIELQSYFLHALSDDEEKQFLKNALLYATHRVESSFASIWDTYLDHEEFMKIGKLINRAHLNITADQELFHIFKIFSALAFNNLIEKTVKGLSDDEAMASFTLSMKLLKHGIYEQNEE